MLLYKEVSLNTHDPFYGHMEADIASDQTYSVIVMGFAVIMTAPDFAEYSVKYKLPFDAL